MEVKNFIKVYDNILPLESLSVLIKVVNQFNYEKALITGDDPNNPIINEDIRKVGSYVMTNQSNKLTEQKWCNVMSAVFKNKARQYYNELGMINYKVGLVKEISALRYTEGGFYDLHHDWYEEMPRQMSFIYLLNNDYEGGELEFQNYHSKDSYKIKTAPNRLIIWPSNFMFPHKVNKVTRGIRYSIVAWMH